MHRNPLKNVVYCFYQVLLVEKFSQISLGASAQGNRVWKPFPTTAAWRPRISALLRRLSITVQTQKNHISRLLAHEDHWTQFAAVTEGCPHSFPIDFSSLWSYSLIVMPAFPSLFGLRHDRFRLNKVRILALSEKKQSNHISGTGTTYYNQSRHIS